MEPSHAENDMLLFPVRVFLCDSGAKNAEKAEFFGFVLD
jgi:hypothetical protein